MLRAPRTTLFVATAIALAGCGDIFVTGSGAAGSGGTSSTGGGGSTGGTTTGGGGASAGSGGGGVTCDSSDADGDGSSPCDGDCDDTNPFVHPGALEICADGADEDCDGIDNTGSDCNAYTIYVSQQLGNTGATGKQSDPVASVAEGVGLAMGLGAQAAVLVAGGTYIEDLTVTGKISVVGGYAPGDWSVRDPEAHTTTIKSSVPEGVRLAGVDGEMLFDGFTIAGRAVSVGSDSSVALTIDGGGPVVSRSKIAAGAVGVGTGDSIGVLVIADSVASATPRLWLDEITAGPSSGGAAYGILMDAPAQYLQVAESRVSAGKGTDSVGLLVLDAANVIVWKSSFQSGTAVGTFNDPSSSLGFWAQRGTVIFDSNVVNADQLDNPPTCFTPNVWCGGVRLSTGAAIVSNNILLGSASDHSAALHLVEDDDDLASVVVTSNTLYGSGHSAFESESAAIVLGSPRVEAGGGATLVGRIRNNILVGGFAVSNYGVREQSTIDQTCDPAAFDHNLFFFPINNPNAGVLYQDWTGSDGVDLLNLQDLPGDGKNLLADPKLTSGHIGKDSPCRNAGTEVDAPNHDRDDDLRPQENDYDIGPDELVVVN